MNILIVGARLSNNKGSAAMMISTIKTLREFIPDINFTALTHQTEIDLDSYTRYNIRIVEYKNNIFSSLVHICYSALWNIAHNYLKLNVHRLISGKLLKEYNNSDMIIDLSGDTFSDDYGTIVTMASCYRIMLCKLLNKPIVIYAQSIGPFNTILTKFLSRFCLNKVDLLIVRDEITRNYLKNIRLSNTVYFTADSAFLLEPSCDERIKEILLKESIDINDKHIVGISVSQHIYDIEIKDGGKNRNDSYIELMAQIVDFLIDELNVYVIFVPHVTNNEFTDDRFVAMKIYNTIKNKHKTKLINGDYGPEELKGIIGQCNLFIGARMHACIASTSMFVPTIAIAYSHKAHGIIGDMLNCKEYVIDIKDLTYNLLIFKIENAWKNREKIRQELITNVSMVQEQSRLNGNLVKQLLDKLESEKI